MLSPITHHPYAPTQNPIEEKWDTVSRFKVQKIALYGLAGMCGVLGFSIVG